MHNIRQAVFAAALAGLSLAVQAFPGRPSLSVKTPLARLLPSDLVVTDVEPSGIDAQIAAYDRTNLTVRLGMKQDRILDLSRIRCGTEKAFTAVQPEDLAPYETKEHAEATYLKKGETPMPIEVDPIWESEKTNYETRVHAEDTYQPKGDYETVGHAADTYQPKGDYETSQHAADTYQPKGNYLTAESDPTVADWAKKPNPAPVTDLSPAFAYTTAVSNRLEGSKRDATNRVWSTEGLTEPANVHWTWASASTNCPQDFLDRMAEYGAPKPVHHPETGTLGTWANVVVFEPDGRPLYVCYLKDKEWDATNIVFRFAWLAPDGVTTNADFLAEASRPSATDTTPVPVGRNDRLALDSEVGQKAGLVELYRVEKEVADDIDEVEDRVRGLETAHSNLEVVVDGKIGTSDATNLVKAIALSRSDADARYRIRTEYGRLDILGETDEEGFQVSVIDRSGASAGVWAGASESGVGILDARTNAVQVFTTGRIQLNQGSWGDARYLQLPFTNGTLATEGVVDGKIEAAIPKKVALSSVTNASGGAVSAVDVAALPDSRTGLSGNDRFVGAVDDVVRLPAFRGQFHDYNALPTSADGYLPDRGSVKTPRAGDLITVDDWEFSDEFDTTLTQTSVSDGSWTICAGNGWAVAFNGSSIMRTSDGMNWSASQSSYAFNGMSYGNGTMFIGYTSGGGVYYSTDNGARFTYAMTVPNFGGMYVVANETAILALGTKSLADSHNVAYAISVYGDLVQATGLPSNTYFARPSAVGNKFYLPDNALNKLYYATGTPRSFTTINNVEYPQEIIGNGNNLVCHMGARLVYSDNGGSQWSNSNVSDFKSYGEAACYAYGGGTYVASSKGRLMFSTDGHQWTVHDICVSFKSAAYHNGTFLFSNNDGIWRLNHKRSSAILRYVGDWESKGRDGWTFSSTIVDSYARSIVMCRTYTKDQIDRTVSSLTKPRPVALFVLPLNGTDYRPGDAYFTGFELYASVDSPFTGPENGGWRFVSDDPWVYVGYTDSSNTRYRVDNGNPVADDVSSAVQRDILVVVDPAKMPENMRSSFSGLNDDLAWSWVRLRGGEKETYEHSGAPLTRPIEPSRWLKQPPAWTQE